MRPGIVGRGDVADHQSDGHIFLNIYPTHVQAEAPSLRELADITVDNLGVCTEFDLVGDIPGKTQQQGIVSGVEKLDIVVVDGAIGIVEKARIGNIVYPKADKRGGDVILVSERSAEAQVVVLGYSG